ncbi:MAG: hypothetical protein KC933_08890 [Myxococcales bacterium]|nr:hypothetical protein [Myxococcales bacterium]
MTYLKRATRHRAWLTLLLAPLLVAAEPAPEAGDESPPPPTAEAPSARRRAAPPEVFEDGLGHYYADDFESAAAEMFDYLSTNEDTVENYEWAEYFLGVSLKELGFTHAAAEYLYNVAKNRTRPEILPEALEQIEVLMQGPHDEELLFRRLLVDSEFGYLPGRVADFVNYKKAMADLLDGRIEWAERLFDELPDDSPFKPEAIYTVGVQRLKGNRMTDAVKKFRTALNHPLANRDTRNKSRLALARILYEKERYASARKLYDQVEVPELTTAEASLYLEKAWTSYFLKDYRRTMGILYALEAPSYRTYFAPERFLLRALVYRSLCHYIPAKREIRRFNFRYDRTLANIRARIDLRDDEVLRTAALSRGALQGVADFRRLLSDEADRIDTIGGSWVEVGLDEHLRRLYALKAEQVDLHLASELTKATRAVAEELVDFEEQMYLLDYEVGLEIYKRLRKENARRPSKADNLDIPYGGDQVYYAFDDEFWNDELAHYDFFVENRCFDEGGDE